MERKLGLSSRNENSRNMLVPDMHVSKLDEMYDMFIKHLCWKNAEEEDENGK